MWWSLQKLMSLGQSRRVSLAQFALQYHPEDSDPMVRVCWEHLARMVQRSPVQQQDAIVTGLHAFLSRPIDQEPARICFTAGCEVGIEVSAGSFCILPGDEEPACCDSGAFALVLDQVIRRYEQRLH